MKEKTGVVIPCYKVSVHICDLIRKIGHEVDFIIVVDDSCPEKSGALVEKTFDDPRIRVVYHTANQGVGGAILTGYQTAIEIGANGTIGKLSFNPRKSWTLPLPVNWRV